MPYYAQIDLNTYKCVAVSELSCVSECPHLIPIGSYDTTFMGKIYNTLSCKFEEDPNTNRYLYIHTTISGGDGLTPPGIVNDNIETITLTGSIRNTVDPLSTITSSINGTWRITIRNTSGLIYDIIKVNVVDGRFSVAYKTDNKPDECIILESDFDKVTLNNTEYTMKLVNPINFKVYKDLS